MDGGFDDDDDVQQLMSLVVLVAVMGSAIYFAPSGEFVTLLLWGVGGIAAMWYLLIAKGAEHPFAWVGCLRAITKAILRKSH